jgi:hypothetical protein
MEDFLRLQIGNLWSKRRALRRSKGEAVQT